MRCKFCGAEIPDGTNFCPNCGKDLSKLRRCVKCGEMIDDDATFCPFCGTQQPRQQQAQTEQTMQPKAQQPTRQTLNQSSQPTLETPAYGEHAGSSNKWLWIVVAAVVAVIAIGGVYYFMEVRPSKTVAVAGDGNSAFPDSTASVEERESTTPSEERQEVEEKPVEESAELNDNTSSTAPSTSDVSTTAYEAADLFDVVTSRKLTESDIAGLGSSDLKILRNYIYAIHGYIFKTRAMKNYFEVQDWYNGTIADQGTVYRELSSVERYNVNFIKRHE